MDKRLDHEHTGGQRQDADPQLYQTETSTQKPLPHIPSSPEPHGLGIHNAPTDIEMSNLDNKRPEIATTGVAGDQGDTEYFSKPAQTAADLVTEVIHAQDDPTLNPWTFRVWFCGIGLSIFGGVLATIYYFKPQSVTISTIFLAVISYVLGEFFAKIIPRRGLIGGIFNPHPVS
jgi:hypothetical protein